VKTFAERFWRRVDKGGPLHPYEPALGPCWLWTTVKDRDGYGRLGRYTAHRLSLAHATGGDRPGLCALHSCDNPGCVNPAQMDSRLRRARKNGGDK